MPLKKFNKHSLPPQFQPQHYEQSIYKLWEEAGVFSPSDRPQNKKEKTFSILMPPPNANGSLHVGHSVFVTLQDLMIRYHRMQGEATVWFPGLDHAGFETQVVFEKYLEKQGRSRFQMERDEFYEATLKFTQENSQNILSQLKRLGASADWSRLKFTLDPDIVEEVYKTFVRLYEDGLVYRSNEPVHWCTRHQTTLSDLEVIDQTQTDKLYFLKYGPITVATTRPETIFGDVAIAVNPSDKRYKKFIGQSIEVDFGIEKRILPVIADHMIEPEFGSGAVKITPMHDLLDFEIAKRHELPMDRLAIDQFGKLTKLAGKFQGMKISAAREEIVKLLAEKGLIAKIEDYEHSVKVCYKCRHIIEPRVIPQWFVAVNKKGKKSGKVLAQGARDAVKKGQVQFITKRFKKIFNHWMKNIRDWNISRQIVWGIRLPVWYCSDCGEILVKVPSTTQIIFMRHGESEHNILKIGNGDPKKPYHLTAKGQKQVDQAAREFHQNNWDFDLIISSQMPRAYESAKIIAKTCGGKIILDKRLNDIELGGLEGKSIQWAHKITEYHQKSVEGSETIQEVQDRVADFIKDLARHHESKKRVLVVTSEIIFWALRGVLNPDLTPHEMQHKVPNAGYSTFYLSDLNPCPRCGKNTLKRDTDVFDTWFSSGQWPVVALKTNKPGDFERFYPTSVMESGWDIIFFWIARMLMLGIYLTDKVPFENLYLHGMVRDKDRQKMSKSRGNVIDPLAVVADYGADALRMAIVFGTAAGNDIPVGEEKVRGMRNFTNKLWNVARFILGNIENKSGKMNNVKAITEADQKILAQLDSIVQKVTQDYKQFRFHKAAQSLYQFMWRDLADNYLESSKDQLNDSKLSQNTQKILLHVLSNALKLLHPIIPFVTEIIWQELPKDVKDADLLIVASWPK